jgi:hypothetical protein
MIAFRDYMNWTIPFYKLSIVGGEINRLRKRVFMEGNVKHTLIPFMRKLDKIAGLDQPTFSFVHHMAPHFPYEVTETCDPISKPFANEFSGYRANYRCALLEIEDFVEKLSSVDPNSIIVIQSDHGWAQLDPLVSSEKRLMSLSAKIFNAIKAPEVCFENYGIPQSTVNSIRFALNCAYGFKFPFEENFHFRPASFKNKDPNIRAIERYEWKDLVD